MLKLKLGKKRKGEAPIGDDADLPAVREGGLGADAGDAAAPGKKKVPLLFIIIAAALVVAGGGGAAAFLMMKPRPAEAGGPAAPPRKKDGGAHGAEGEATAGEGVIASGPDGVIFYTLPDMIVNIQSTNGRPAYLKLKLTLEMTDASVASQLQAEGPRLQDMFQGFLRELRPEDLAGSAGSFQLRAEILRRVNLIAAPAKVDAVLIEEMLVQ